MAFNALQEGRFEIYTIKVKARGVKPEESQFLAIDEWGDVLEFKTPEAARKYWNATRYKADEATTTIVKAKKFS